MNSVKKITNYVFDRYKVIDKVAFYINEEYIFDHYSSVMEGLDSNIFDIVLEDKFKQKIKSKKPVSFFKKIGTKIKFAFRNIFKRSA